MLGKILAEQKSYRPICLFDTASKCLERKKYNRLLNYVEEANRISTNQFRFRKANSTVDAISLIMNAARKAIQDKTTSKEILRGNHILH